MKKTSTFLTVGSLAVASALGALMLMSPPARSTQDSRRDRSGAGEPDAAFFERALRSGAAVAAASRMAHQRTSNEQIRQLAAQMERDHTATNRRLAAAGGIRVPALDGRHRAMHDRLRESSGSRFDQMWLEQMRQSHLESIALYNRVINTATSEDTRELAEATLPVLESHLERLEDLIPAQRYGASGTQLAAGDAGDDEDADEALQDADDASTATGQGMGAGVNLDRDLVDQDLGDLDEGNLRGRAMPDGGAG